MDKTQRIVKVLTTLRKKHGTTMLARMSALSTWRLLIGAILSARARDEVTEPLCKELFKKYPNAKALANAKSGDVQRMIKRIGFYRNKAKNIINASKKIREDYKGKVPDKLEDLLKIPGVGQKVANCVLVYGYNAAAIPVDTHVHRISNRLGVVKTKSPNQTEKELMKVTPKRYWKYINDYLVYHGKTVCKPQRPRCKECVIRKCCRRVGVMGQK